jgi:hypothetical protein
MVTWGQSFFGALQSRNQHKQAQHHLLIFIGEDGRFCIIGNCDGQASDLIAAKATHERDERVLRF